METRWGRKSAKRRLSKTRPLLAGRCSTIWHKPSYCGQILSSDVEVEYGTDNLLSPALSEAHVNMMAFSQCIGIGLFLQAGVIIHLAGPGFGFIAYLLVGTILWSSTASLGEMSAMFPVKGPIIEFPKRFLGESFGYTAGWVTWQVIQEA
jgi:amino acid permease